MKIKVDVKELRSALQIVTMSLPSKPPYPISECVLIEAQDDSVKLTCTDFIMQVSRSLEGQVDEPGRCAVRGKVFDEVVKKMPDSELDIQTSSNGKTIVMRCSGTKSQMACMDPETFPVKEDFSPTTTVKIDSSCLLEMISDTEGCIARADAREVLTGGCIDVEKGIVRMVALDGYRLAVKGFSCSCEQDMTAIIPSRSLAVLKKILATDESELVEMLFTKEDFGLTFGNASIKCTLINGEYVPWRQIVPKSCNTTVRISAGAFKSAVERAYIVAKSGEANNLIRIDILENSMSIHANNSLDDMYDVMDVEHEGEPIKIAFNVNYLNDLLKVFSGDDIVLKLVNSISPCIVEYAEMPGEARDFFWLILPVRTST